MSDKVSAALLAVAEITRAKWSDATAQYILRELSAHPEADVLYALRRCARECKYPVSLSDILERLPKPPPAAPYHRMITDARPSNGELKRLTDKALKDMP